MRITADTNILVRVIVRDDIAQAQTALGILDQADAVFIPLPGLCEFVWVLDRTYGLSRKNVAASIRAIIARANVTTDMAAVTAGLLLLDSGGDFADGVIAAAGDAMGADIFVSFDRKAVAQVGEMGLSARNALDLA